MPILEWDDLDFLECLETVPDVEEYGAYYSYNVIRGNHRLLVTVLPLESVVELSLFPEQAETSLVEFSVFVRGAVSHVNDKRGEHLEFPDSIVAPNRVWYMKAGDVFDHDRFPVGVMLQLSIKPGIRLRFM